MLRAIGGVADVLLRAFGGEPGNRSDALPRAAWWRARKPFRCSAPGGLTGSPKPFRCPVRGRVHPDAPPAEERTPRAYCAEIAFRLEGMSPVSRLKAREK